MVQIYFENRTERLNVLLFVFRIDVALAFHILADAGKTNIDILETIQLLAQGEIEKKIIEFNSK